MPRPECPIDPSSPYAALATALRDLRWKHDLGYREMSEITKFSRSVLAEAARGQHLPTWEVALAFVRACEPDLDEIQQAGWHRLWTDARDKAKGNRS